MIKHGSHPEPWNT